MKETDLIKTVRRLDQDGPGSNGENLQNLWNCLTASSEGPFHAAEETGLRWLLKSMNGTSENAETMRRYPVTWTILDCIFQRIPLFPLAKSLADRKFIAVLQQTLKESSTPTTKLDTSGPSKRKRSPNSSFNLITLTNGETCLEVSKAIFSALKSLLSRLNNKALSSSRDRIGAEHIRSLFCTSAEEAATLVSPSLRICENSLSGGIEDDTEDKRDWIQTISVIWDFHLQAKDDTLVVATHLFNPSVSLLYILENFSGIGETGSSDVLKSKWSADVQNFIQRNLILPARASFINRQNFEAITTALEVSKSRTHVSVPALFFLASATPDATTEGHLRRKNTTWMKEIFQAVELAIRDRADRSTLMQQILKLSLGRSVPFDVERLCFVCDQYALKGGATDWALIAKVAVCEPDVFKASEQGKRLLSEVCKRSLPQPVDSGDYEAITEVIGAICESFRIHRDFSGFLRLWFTQLSEIEKRELDTHSPWFTVGRTERHRVRFDTLVETENSPQQVIEIIEWVQAQGPLSSPEATCLFASSIAQGIHSEVFTDAVGRRLLDLVLPVKDFSNITALKWRAVSSTVAWLSPTDRTDAWSVIYPPLSKLLKKSPIKSAGAFEAFKCCCEIWDVFSPDAEQVSEPAAAIEVFTSRLVSELSTSGFLQTASLPQLELNSKTEYREESAHLQYISWYLLESSRLVKLQSSGKHIISPIVLNATSTDNVSVESLRVVWHALLSNDVNLNDSKVSTQLVDRLITAMETSEIEKDWPGERGQMWITALGTIPLDNFSRTQRERIMVILDKRRTEMLKSPKMITQESWKLVLGLATKMMSRPTFYEGMQFLDLIEVADAMSALSLDEASTSHEILLELIQRFFAMASVVIKQMAENADERSEKYFQGSKEFINTSEDEKQGSRPFRITLLKALTVELTRLIDRQNRGDLEALQQSAKEALSKHITLVFDGWMAAKQLFSTNDTTLDLNLFAAVDAAPVVDKFPGLSSRKSTSIRKLEKRSQEASKGGDLRGWKLQTFLHNYLLTRLDGPRPTTFDITDNLPRKLREQLVRELVSSVIHTMDASAQAQYLGELVGNYVGDYCTDGQLFAIGYVVNQLTGSTDTDAQNQAINLSAAHGELAGALLRPSSNTLYICRILHTILEKKPQAMAQWNVEICLSTICSLLSAEKSAEAAIVPFSGLCKLVEVIIKKHRLRLEGHYHLLLVTMQALLRYLVIDQSQPNSGNDSIQEANAHNYARLITLICEPTAGAVSRSQHQGALDSATDAAKRSAGRHMYMILMLYVKIQLESNVPRTVREALEPAMNSIFDITSPEGRKILNDGMDGSGRAILREMFKRYVNFGKWKGV